MFLVPSGLISLFHIWKWTEDSQFAREFFDDKVDIVRIVASKRWHHLGDDWIACGYAAVEFSEDTAATLQEAGPKALIGKGWRRGGQERWDVHWQPTPVGKWTENRPADPLYACLKYFPDGDAALIKDALKTEGSWYFRGGEVATFLSAKTRIAATLRFGD